MKFDAKLEARGLPFKYTNPSKHEIEYRNNRITVWVIFFIYSVVVMVLAWFFYDSGPWSNAIYYPILVGLNLVIIFLLGFLITRAIVFPYSFWGSRNAIIGANCIRYGEEFASLVEKSYVLMRIHMMKQIEEEYEK